MTAAEREQIAEDARPSLLGRIFPKSIFGTRLIEVDLKESVVETWTFRVERFGLLDPPADFGFAAVFEAGDSVLFALCGGSWQFDPGVVPAERDRDLLADEMPRSFFKEIQLERLPKSGGLLRFQILDATLVPATHLLQKKDLDYFGITAAFPGALSDVSGALGQYLRGRQERAR